MPLGEFNRRGAYAKVVGWLAMAGWPNGRPHVGMNAGDGPSVNALQSKGCGLAD